MDYTFREEVREQIERDYRQFLSALYRDARDSSQGENLDHVWIPPVPDGEEAPNLIGLNRWHKANDDDPWVVKTRAAFPVLVPKIKFRHCLGRCYEKEEDDMY